MTTSVPMIDTRTRDDIAEQTRKFLCTYLNLADPPYNWEDNADGGEAGRTLTKIFAQYCGIITDRLNRAPEKNFLAFLDLLGNSLIPAQPARAAVTFLLDSSATAGVMLPAGTRVQAESPPGAKEPVCFETENDLWLTTLNLLSAQNSNDLTGIINNPGNAGKPLFKNKDNITFCFSTGPGQRPPAQSPIELYFWIDSAFYDPASWNANAIEKASLGWEWSGLDNNWSRLLVEDETAALTRTGVIRFLTPSETAWKPVSVKQDQMFQFSVRVISPKNPYNPPPMLRCIALNTVSAIQVQTVENEILGSSNGNSGQMFTTLKKPVLPGQQLDVLEQQTTTAASAGTSLQSSDWVPWQEVTDFHSSKALDRHYLLNRQSGQVCFGNGRNGMIPPLGARNIKMTRYQAGGGAVGNVAAAALKTLVSGSKNISRVTNLFAASGGSDEEDTAALLDRAPRTLRHRHRAVTREDYEDLSRLSTTEVAKALCVPLQDLAVDPYLVIDSTDQEKAGVGKVSIIIVPNSMDAHPLPSPDLIRLVQAFLAERACAEAAISVVGPLYIRANIEIDIVLKSLLRQDIVERELLSVFAGFLHPLTGNNGSGWPFGRKPQPSDLYPLISGKKEIAFVAGLTIIYSVDYPGKTLEEIEQTGRFLVYSGTHKINYIQNTL
jgi:hypothetical protein